LLAAQQHDSLPRSFEAREDFERKPRTPDHIRKPTGGWQPKGAFRNKKPHSNARFADRKAPRNLTSRRAFAQAGANKG
jgi:hypothetical protein